MVVTDLPSTGTTWRLPRAGAGRGGCRDHYRVSTTIEVVANPLEVHMTTLLVRLQVLAMLPGQAIPDPAPQAPPGLDAKVSTVLGMIKWTSLISIVGVLLAAGWLVWSGDHGRGGGLSPEMKGALSRAVIALLIVGGASGIVQFVSG